jgi:hypothetical protein
MVFPQETRLDFQGFQARLERRARARAPLRIVLDAIVAIITLIRDNGGDLAALLAQLLEL